MRIQILPLPRAVVGEVSAQPFALVVDQYDGPTTEEEFDRWNHFKQGCGAEAVLVTPETVEVVDRYAASASDEAAVREFERLDDFLLLNFGDEPGLYEDNDSAADVAIRLLREVLRQRETQKLTDGWPKLQRDHSEGEAP